MNYSTLVKLRKLNPMPENHPGGQKEWDYSLVMWYKVFTCKYRPLPRAVLRANPNFRIK